jgi:molybdenum cofactor cytidylyltransferase
METIPGLREAHAQGHAPAAGFWAVVLAAGAGSRFGGDKLRARWGDGSLIQASLTVARAAPVEGVLVLTRPGDRLIDDLTVQRPAVQEIEVADWAEGMGATLRAGIAALPPSAAGVYVFLGDMPRIPLSVLAPLAEAVRAGAPAAAPVFEGRIGHPVLLSAALFGRLMALTGDRGARRLLDTFGDRLVLVPAPNDGVVFDVDTPGDLDHSGRIDRGRPAQ